MTEIIPAVLAKDFEELRGGIARVAGVTSVVQIDICDGRFVPSVSWPMNTHDQSSVNPILDEQEGLPYWDSIDFEFDLMILNATEQFDFFVRLGAKRIVFHIEAQKNIEQFKEFLEGMDMYTKDNIQIGVAINTTTSVDILKSIIYHIDFVQCMGIEQIGKQGEPFDERVLAQIKSLRTLYPELIISVDGSVNENTAPSLIEAGANRLIVGSALMNSYNIRETIKEFENM